MQIAIIKNNVETVNTLVYMVLKIINIKDRAIIIRDYLDTQVETALSIFGVKIK